MTNILFICKYNRFRSRIAEAEFNKINKNKSNTAKSAGIIQGSYPLDARQVKLARELNISLKGKPHGLSTKLLQWQDIAIIVANDVPSIILNGSKRYGKKVIKWNIPDDKTGAESEINKIKNKTQRLVGELS
ncbi:hypothetical protein HYZ97_03535 [Candidatus Pacearchaeota archaeon]|nr:hypothetical protein [Candidatus Pacearchaeota archaeon]